MHESAEKTSKTSKKQSPKQVNFDRPKSFVESQIQKIKKSNKEKLKSYESKSRTLGSPTPSCTAEGDILGASR